MTFEEKVNKMVIQITESKNKLETAYELVVLSVPENPPALPSDISQISPAEQLLIYGKRFTNNYAELLLLLLQKIDDKNGKLKDVRTKSCGHYFVEYMHNNHLYILDPSQEEIIEDQCSFRYYMLNGAQMKQMNNENYIYLDYDISNGENADYFTQNWQYCETPECVKACFGVIQQQKPAFRFIRCVMDPKQAFKCFQRLEKEQTELEQVHIEKYLIHENLLYMKLKYSQNSKISQLMNSLKGFMGIDSKMPINLE